MSATSSQDATPSDVVALLLQLNAHTLLLRLLATLVEYGIPDHVSAGPSTAQELASTAGLDAQALYRVLRFVASHGFFREDEQGRFHLTPRADALRAAAPGSVRDRLRRPWQDALWRSYERLPETLRTGVPAFELAHGRPFFDYLAEQPELNAIFDRSMARLSQIENPVIAASYPFERCTTVVDVAGGRGGLLAAVLERHAGVNGVLFEQPQVLAAAERHAEPLHAGRWQQVAGDFFHAIPAGADLYVLKRIIHDWDDDRALAILRNCREALRGDARLLIIDAVLQPGNDADPNKFMDVNMMALARGRERKEREVRDLCAGAGLAVIQVTRLPTPATLSIVEARLA
jgi:hypothetical protein